MEASGDLKRPATSSPTAASSSNWESLWGDPDDGPVSIQWHRLRRQTTEIAEAVPVIDKVATFGALVGSEELRTRPVHRWFTYKEGFSPRLLGEVIGELELGGDPMLVADTFGGVATTALAGLMDPRVAEVRSLEYSPFARFAGRAKLTWPQLDPTRLRTLLPSVLAYEHQRPVEVPDLAAFANRRIFSSQRIRTLLAVREHLRELDIASHERDFFLLGLAGAIEDLSGAMKDGRALRIRGDRVRRPSALVPQSPTSDGGPVKHVLASQWLAMIEDVEALEPQRPAAREAVAHHVAGDARDLAAALLDDGQPAFPRAWADLSLFSPPYLNLIDYTELYKLELWLLEHIASQEEFRQTRLGTLRSHPSIRFEERDYFNGESGVAVELVRGAANWVAEHGPRPEVGHVVRQYFEDMLQVWREQFRILKPGATAVCVVANSTFTRRDGKPGARQELWRLPILTDVILARLAQLAGFEDVHLWHARDLRPRNARAARARESLVVARRP